MGKRPKGSRRPTKKRPPAASGGDLEREMQFREDLLESSLGQVFEAYDEAIDDDVKSPVVVLIDCRDAIGGPLARSWAGDEAVDDALAAYHGRQVTTTLAHAVSLAEARRDVAKMFPYLAGSFQQAPPSGQFIAVVVAGGGAATFFVPPDARPAWEA